MSVLIKESDLPQDLTAEDAVEAAYSSELAEVASKLNRGLPTLIECDKDLGPYLYLNVRNRLRNHNLRCLYLDGRPRQEEQQGAMPTGMIGTMIAQLREAVRGAVERRVVVLPHLDLLTTSQGGLTAEAREVIPLLYENPELVWLGFKDPSFPLPKVIENLFPHRIGLLGIGRNRLRHLITRRESRKFGREFNPWGLYKYVSGINAVRLRKLLTTLEGEDYPANPQNAYRQLRQATLGGTLEVPTISLTADIGGYAKVKERLRNEILELLGRKEQITSEEQIKGIEDLIPKGMIFWGPPGTGKTLFAKAMASEIGAAITVVSGPELKSKWVGESLPWEEEVPVVLNGEYRRLPIGQLVDEHDESDEVLTWTAGDDGSARLAPVTGFIRHKGPDYIDVLVTETGREVRVTGGHSLFVNRDGKLAEVFAEQVEPGQTRVAVPLRLEAPEWVREMELMRECEEGEVQEVGAVREVGSKPTRRNGWASGISSFDGAPTRTPLTEELAEDMGASVVDACSIDREARVPPAIFLAPKPIVAAFLRGYFRGDDPLSGDPIESPAVSRGLAADLMTLLQYFGIVARLRKEKHSGSTRYRLGLHEHEGHITNDVLWDLVVEKRREPYAREHVYDLSVPQTERFIAGFGNVLVHNSEENLRQIFHKARQSAPAIIVFDELDSFATARGTYSGSGVEHSMVNQLLTEMDGFHKDEMVFVVGTTNFVESLDPALLRPGRFEFHLHIPYPDGEARRAILEIYDRKMNLKMSPETLDHAVDRTDWLVPGAASGTYFSGDHLNALCRSVARFRMREGRTDATTPADIERALTEWVEKTKLTELEERVTATHEAGHAVCTFHTPGARPVKRIAIADDVVGALGYVRTQEAEHKYYRTISHLKADIVVCFGGTEAEKLLLGETSMGLESDLDFATHCARLIVESMGMGGADAGVGRYRVRTERGGETRDPHISEHKREVLDERIDEILAEGQRTAAALVREHRAEVEQLRDKLIKEKVIDAKKLTTFRAADEPEKVPEKEEKKSRAKEKNKAE